MSETYRILLRGDAEESKRLPRADIRERLCSVPKIVPCGEDRLEFGDADDDGVMRLTLRGPDPESLSAIEVEIPRPWVMESGPQVFALIFMVQGWTGWEVYDPQIDDTLQREAVLQGLVAMRQARMQQEGHEVPQARLEPEAKKPPQRKWRFW